MILVQPRLCAATVQSLEDAEPTNTIQQLRGHKGRGDDVVVEESQTTDTILRRVVGDDQLRVVGHMEGIISPDRQLSRTFWN